MMFYLVQLFSIFQFIDWSQQQSYLTDTQLHKYLIKDQNYQWQSIPTQGQSQMHNIKFKMEFMNILQVDLKSQTAQFQVLFLVEWIDQRLKWQPSSYDGIEYTQFYCPASSKMNKRDLIWIPDTLIRQSGINPLIRGIADQNTNAIVRYDGKVFYKVLGRINVMLITDYTYFPFEIQNLQVSILNWMHLMSEIEWVIDSANIKSIIFKDNADMSNSMYEMKKDNFKYKKINETLDNGLLVQTYNVINLDFTIQRLGKSIISQLLLPVCISFFLCIVSFLNDRSKPLRIVISTGNMMKILLFLVLSNNYVPQTNIQPILQMTILYFFYVTYAVVASQIVIQWYSKTYQDIHRQEQQKYQKIEEIKKKTEKILTLHQCVNSKLGQSKTKNVANKLVNNLKKSRTNKNETGLENKEKQANEKKEEEQKKAIVAIKKEDKEYFQDEDSLEFRNNMVDIDIDFSMPEDDDDEELDNPQKNIEMKLDKLGKDNNSDNRSELSMLIDQQLQEHDQVANHNPNDKSDIELMSLNDNSKNDLSIQNDGKSRHQSNIKGSNDNEVVNQNLLEIDLAEKQEQELKEQKRKMLKRFWTLKYRNLYPENLDQILFSVLVISYGVIVIVSIALVIQKYHDNETR